MHFPSESHYKNNYQNKKNEQRDDTDDNDDDNKNKQQPLLRTVLILSTLTDPSRCPISFQTLYSRRVSISLSSSAIFLQSICRLRLWVAVLDTAGEATLTLDNLPVLLYEVAAQLSAQGMGQRAELFLAAHGNAGQ